MTLDSQTSSPPPPTSGGGGDPILILLLNLFLFGVGSIVIGQKAKGIVFIIAALAVAIPTCGTASLAISACAAIDGYLQAKQREKGNAIGEWTFFNTHR